MICLAVCGSAEQSTYRDHLNQYDVIKINMQEFLSVTNSVDEMLGRLKRYLLFDLLDAYPEICTFGILKI